MNLYDILNAVVTNMKYIFLDFDGVINNWNSNNCVSPENVMVLKKILNKTDAKIVVTSSNKYGLQIEESYDYYLSKFYREYIKPLNDFGIEIYDITPYVNGNRTLEIEKYLLDSKVKNYVIIDDELVGASLQEHQVFLDLYKGLQDKHIEPTLKILNGDLGFYPNDYDRSETPKQLNYRINKYYNSLKNKN